MSDRTKKPKPFRYPREVDADELDALEAKAAKWDEALLLDDATRIREASAVDELATLRADAAKWRAAQALFALAPMEADARRWRTVERAVDSGASFHITASIGGFRYEIDYLHSTFSGPTLAAAADSLAERMDKEATE